MTGQGFESILECLPPKCMRKETLGTKTSVHIVQASKCSHVSVCVCRVVPDPSPWHALAAECHQSASCSVLSGCLRSAPQKALSRLWFALLPSV